MERYLFLIMKILFQRIVWFMSYNLFPVRESLNFKVCSPWIKPNKAPRSRIANQLYWISWWFDCSCLRNFCLLLQHWSWFETFEKWIYSKSRIKCTFGWYFWRFKVCFSIIISQKAIKNMFPPGLEPGTFRVLGERDNHYTTETCSGSVLNVIINSTKKLVEWPINY